MKSKKKRNPLFKTFFILSVLILLIAAASISLFYYIFSIPEPEGLSLASWPETFTDNFSLWMEYEDGSVKVKDIGIDRLDEYGLWVQVIDQTGHEIFSHSRPQNFPSSYSSSELLTLAASKYENGNTIFVSSFKHSGKTWGYIIGFPYAVGKYMLYYNGEHVSRLSPLATIISFLVLCAFILFVIGYALWLSQKLSVITGGIKDVSLRNYKPLKETSIFSEVYQALNKMDMEVRHSDRVKEETDRTRREWIANITHDLKTPLSPIKGYAELLADNSVSDKQSIQEYARIILKNTNHVEKLINDLKLTYQLDSGAMPFSPQNVPLIRYLREFVIDIVNDPVFSNRIIEFESDMPELTACIDPDLFHRAVRNLITNALIHNPTDTKVNISVNSASEDGIYIFIRDNGTGISTTDQSKLFNRYYRGTNTKESSEGSGLGLAIAKQIITLHQGEITVKSKLKEGTEFRIFLPV